ncbi:MAG: PH domain-containing protein [Actinomycetota bacterium]
MSAPFSNEPIPVDHLPRLQEDAFEPVDRRYLRAWLVILAIGAVVVVAAGGIVAALVDEPLIPIGIAGVVLVGLAVTASLWTAEVRRLGYLIREHDLSLRSGVIRHSVETLPFARVQHVTITRGPIERFLGLSTLQVSTAGPDISVPGLAETEATRLRALVTERAGQLEADPSTLVEP